MHKCVLSTLTEVRNTIISNIMAAINKEKELRIYLTKPTQSDFPILLEKKISTKLYSPFLYSEQFKHKME